MFIKTMKKLIEFCTLSLSLFRETEDNIEQKHLSISLRFGLFYVRCADKQQFYEKYQWQNFSCSS